MQGTQAYYYALPEDHRALEARLERWESMVYVPSRCPSADPEIHASPLAIIDGTPWLFWCIVRRCDLDKLEMRYVEQQGYWRPGQPNVSLLVEYDLSNLHENVLNRGRMYFTRGFHHHGEPATPKPDAFVTWAARLVSTTRRFFQRDISFYAGSHALAWLAQNPQVRRGP